VPEDEVKVRAARIPASLKRGFRETNPLRCLKSLAEWLTGYFLSIEGRVLREDDLTRIFGRSLPWRTVLGAGPERVLREPKTLTNGAEMQRETPLTKADVEFLACGPRDPLALTSCLIDLKQPRWLIGWRDITNATNERTVVASVFPKVGVGHTMPLLFLGTDPAMAPVKLALWTSLPFDFIARLSVGGSHLTYSYLKQFATLPPNDFTSDDLSFINPRVLELTYTSHSMRPWAEDLGFSGAPFAWDEERRANLRAELDAFFALKYGLTHEELRYVLDPTDVKGVDYPSETFRILRTKEEERFGEYRMRRLVLDAWERLKATEVGSARIEVRGEAVAPLISRNGALARPMPASPGDAGAMLAALSKAMDGPLPARQVRLAATFGLEPRLLLPHLDPNQAAEWQRLIGAEAAPLTGNAASFAPRADRTWGSAVTAHRGNGRLVEDPTTGTWAPGPGLDVIDTAGWPDGRAGMLMRVLPHIATDAVISAMPAEIRGWIDAAAA
jgi:hypothetical protein